MTRVYASLLELELRDSRGDFRELTARLDAIERRADGLRLPAAFADQFYVLRQHIGFVRRRLAAADAESRRSMARSP